MIEINLLPKELRKKKSSFKLPDVTIVFLPAFFGFIGFLIFIQLFLGLFLATKNRTYTRLNSEWNTLLPQKQEIDVIKEEIQKIQKKVNAIDRLTAKGFLWSRKLNELSNSMIPGIWLTRLSLDEKNLKAQPATPEAKKKPGPQKIDPSVVLLTRCLNIEGCASSAYGDETATVGRFIKSLKENKSFFEDFSQIELELMQRKMIKNTELMSFKVICYFKEER